MPGSINVYETADWASPPGDVMRPGGLALTEELLRRSGLVPPAEILDLGCGTGKASAFLKQLGFRVSGLDCSAHLLARARETCPGLKLTEGDAAVLPYPDASFNGVLAECVLSCMESPAAVIKECARVLRLGGVLMLSDLYLRSAGSGTGEGRTLPGKEAWADMLSRHGFGLSDLEDKTQILTEFVLSFLWSGGSMDSLCSSAARHIERGDKVGYLALTAAKREGIGGGS